MKKIIILPASFFLIHILYIGCCKCVESLGGKPYRNITAVTAREYGNARKFSRDTVYVKDSLTVSVSFPFEYIANNYKNPMQPFVGTANAWSCDCNFLQDSGYKYRIDSLKITSDNNIYGIPAGQDISSLFTAAIYQRRSGMSFKDLRIPQALDSIGLNRNDVDLALQLYRPSPVIKTHRFTYKIFINGKVYQTMSMGKLFWE